MSPVVQATPSSQLPPFCAANAHLPALQVLLVQAFLSSQPLLSAQQLAMAVWLQLPANEVERRAVESLLASAWSWSWAVPRVLSCSPRAPRVREFQPTPNWLT